MEFCNLGHHDRYQLLIAFENLKSGMGMGTSGSLVWFFLNPNCV